MDRRSLIFAAAAAGLAGGPAWAQTPAPTFEGVTFESHGKPIRAIHYRPDGEGRRAAIVMMHGSGGRIRSAGPWHELAMRFAADGYEVLTPLYFDAFPDDGIRPPRMMEAWRDVGEHAIDWFIARGVDRRRTGLFGYSLGSHVAVDGALGNNRAAAAIGLAGGTDVYPPRVPRRRIPVLLIRAENDDHVLPRNTEAWVNFLREHDIAVRVEVIAGAGHLFRPEEWREIFARSSEFFGGTIGRLDQDTA